MTYAYGNRLYEFSPECLAFLETRRQLSCISRENGGQLFARFTRDQVRIEVATVTKGRSRRTRLGFWPDREAERADILQLFKQGLHYVGDWHTHPERIPEPSMTDEAKMLEIFQQSAHELEAMLMVIVGQAAFAEGGLFVGAVSSVGVTPLYP